MFELPSMGDVDAKLFIKKEDGKYISEITPASEDQAPVEFELDSTTFEDGIFTIEGYGGGYEIYFELTIEGDILLIKENIKKSGQTEIAKTLEIC